MYQKIIELIHNLTDLEVRFVSKENKEELAVVYPEDQTFPEKGRVELIKDSGGVRFISSLYDGGILLTGPFILEDDPIPRVRANKMSGIDIPARSQVKIQSYLTVIKLLAEGRELPGAEPDKEIETHNPVFEENYSPQIDVIDFRYKWERKIRHYISNGDRTSLKKLISDLDDSYDFSSRLPNNPVRAYKNMAIVTNSIGRLSAEKGGLPPFFLHSISENVAIKIESKSSLKDIYDFSMEIPLIYCDAVYNYGIENHSAVIVKACQYILENLHERIELSDLAGHTGTSRTYLSRQFHKETGRTVSAYIREKRVLEAKWMLRHNGESVTDVALSLGFEDVNYFSRIFRKETGISPSRYRIQARSDDFDGLPD